MAKTAARQLRPLIVLLAIIIAMFGSILVGMQLSDDAGTEDGPSFAPGLALDLEGGVQLILTPKIDEDVESGNTEITPEDIGQAIEIIRQRVDASGVAEAEITRQGSANIVVGLPGNPDEATLDLVRQSAQLRFRPVLTVSAPTPIDPAQLEGTDPAATDAPDEAAGPADDTESATDAAPATPGSDEQTATGDATQEAATEESPAASDSVAGGAPGQEEIEAAAMAAADADGDGTLSTTPAAEPTTNSDLEWLTEQAAYDLYMLDCTDPANLVGGAEDDPEQPLVACSQDGESKLALGPVDVEGTRVTSASSGLEVTSGGATTNNWVVDIAFDGEGTTEFRETSERLVPLQPPQNQFGIVLDGLVISAPRMNDVIQDGRAQISGSFTRESANTLANQLNFGSLPLNFEVQSEDQISATLGSEHLKIGLIAGLIGLLLVAVYLVWQYRGLAVIAVTSLMIAAIVVYGTILLLSWVQGYRLSLAGVTGLVIAVGITADSFILYFERIRDEIREGRTLEGAVHHAWDRAKRTIVISDLVTLMAAVVLYFLAVGGVRGFAFTLGLTTVIDLLVVFTFTHPMMQLLIRTRFFGDGRPWSGLNPEDLGASRATYLGRGQVTRPGRPDRPARGSKKVAPKKVPAAVTGAAPPQRRGTIAERRAAEERARADAAPSAADGPASPEPPAAADDQKENR